MTTTSDDDGTTPVDPGDAYPLTPAYGSRALGEHDIADTAPVQGLPHMVAPEVVAPRAPADEHETVVLPGAAAGASYLSDDVLPAGAVGRGPRAARTRAESRAADGGGTRGRSLPRTGPSPLGRVVLPLILALVSGVAIVAGWVHLQEDRTASESAPSSSPTSSSSPSSAASTSVSPSSTVSVSPSAVTSTPPAVVVSSPAAVPSGSTSPSATPKVDRSVPVVVLNSTSRTGLAAKVAAQLRKDGWTVVSVGNFRGTLAVTTVYAEGHVDAVATMQRDLPTKDRQKSPFGAMNAQRLTVVIGTDYPRS